MERPSLRRLSENPDTFEHVCATAAYHVSELMTTKAPGTLNCGIHNPNNPDKAVNVRITIEPSSMSESEGSVWDQVYIALPGDPPESKGDWCGNRCGGRQVLMGLYADVLRDVALTEAAKAE